MWAYACRARVVGIGCAMLLRMCDMRAAWARVEGAMLQGFSRSLSLSLALSLSRSLARSLALSLSLSPRSVRNGARLRRSSLDKVCRVNPP